MVGFLSTLSEKHFVQTAPNLPDTVRGVFQAQIRVPGIVHVLEVDARCWLRGDFVFQPQLRVPGTVYVLEVDARCWLCGDFDVVSSG